MSPDLLARLLRESLAPSGIAPVIDSPELRQLLVEREDALAALASLSARLEALLDGGEVVRYDFTRYDFTSKGWQRVRQEAIDVIARCVR